jgi:hypothetical protein
MFSSSPSSSSRFSAVYVLRGRAKEAFKAAFVVDTNEDYTKFIHTCPKQRSQPRQSITGLQSSDYQKIDYAFREGFFRTVSKLQRHLKTPGAERRPDFLKELPLALDLPVVTERKLRILREEAAINPPESRPDESYSKRQFFALTGDNSRTWLIAPEIENSRSFLQSDTREIVTLKKGDLPVLTNKGQSDIKAYLDTVQPSLGDTSRVLEAAFRHSPLPIQVIDGKNSLDLQG